MYSGQDGIPLFLVEDCTAVFTESPIYFFYLGLNLNSIPCYAQDLGCARITDIFEIVLYKFICPLVRNQISLFQQFVAHNCLKLYYCFLCVIVIVVKFFCISVKLLFSFNGGLLTLIYNISNTIILKKLM